MLLAQQTDSSGNDSIPKDLKILNFFRGGGKTKVGETSCFGEGQYRKKTRTVCCSCNIAFLSVVFFYTKGRIFARRDQDFFFFLIC